VNKIDELKEFIQQIEYIDDETLENMDFFDTAMYLEKLNQLDQIETELTKNVGNQNE